MSISNFLDAAFYDRLVADVAQAQAAPAQATAPAAAPASGFRLTEANIFVGLPTMTKDEAIRYAGGKLVEAGYVNPPYVEAMLKRETIVSTYLGMSLAVPHGTGDAKDQVVKTGIVICQFPNGVWFGPEENDVARLVIGIAARNNDHMDVISGLARSLEDESLIDRLATTANATEIVETLTASA